VELRPHNPLLYPGTDEPKQLTRTALPAVYLSGFFNAVQQAMSLYRQTEPPPGDNPPLLVEDFPKTRQGQFDTAYDVIQWSVVECVPAGTDRTGHNRRQFRPLVREIIPHPTKDGYSLITYGWWEWATVQFTIFSKSNTTANQLAEWFHFFIMFYSQQLDFMRARGVNKFEFMGRGRDEENERFGGQTLYMRPLKYAFRLEVLKTSEVKTLETIDVKLGENPIDEFTLSKPQKLGSDYELR
jgi:hypothetical protein